MTRKSGPIALPNDAECSGSHNHQPRHVHWTPAKKLLVGFGTLLTLTATILVWVSFLNKSPSSSPDVEFGQQCRVNTVDYQSEVKILASNLELKFDESGTVQAKVIVRSSDSIDTPRLIISGPISTPILGKSELHVDVSYDSITENEKRNHQELVKIWADEAQDKDGLRLCAELEVILELPAKYTYFGNLKVTGQTLSFTTEGVEDVAFKEIEVKSEKGLVKIDDLTTDALVSTVTEGRIFVDRLVSSYNKPIFATLQTEEGEIYLNAFLSLIDPRDEEGKVSRNVIKLFSKEGDIIYGVNTQNLEEEQETVLEGHEPKHTRREEIYVEAKTIKGKIWSKVLLHPSQVLFQASKSIEGRVHSQVSDRFLGDISLRTEEGSVDIQEHQGSPTTIKFQKADDHNLIGHKVLKDRNNGGGAHDVGSIILSSTNGATALGFY
ncbi:hypothetical protein BG004_007712 [Podila humilis]|nr:hypothetical protein BG004_007712 [Podila humilis]